MNDEQSGPTSAGATGDPAAGDPVGSVGEEAAKLFAALSGWASEQGNEQSAHADAAAHGVAEALRSVHSHVATGGDDCRYCPVCQVIHAVRQTSPEVKQHLAVAAGSLLQAAAGVLATQVPRSGATGVEKIDLGADADSWDDPAGP